MERIKNTIKAVIFDMDGTIIKTEHLWMLATEKLLAKRGFVNFTDDQKNFFESLSGIGLEQSAIELKKEFKLIESISSLAEETKNHAHELFETKLEFMDGFERFHSKLSQHLIPTGVATNADSASLLYIDKKLNLQKFFGPNLYCIEVVGNKGKPNPDIFLHTAEQLKAKPHECIVFEDSVYGFQAACAAGMKCIAIKNKTNQKNLSLVHHAIDSYDEAEEALLSLKR